MTRVNILAVILTACLASPTSAQQAATGEDNWTEFGRYNMQRYNPNETILNVNNVANLQVKWSQAIHATSPSPAVVNGVVYTAGSDGPNSNVLFALNASTGALLWRALLSGEAPVQSSPAVADGAVYVGGTDREFYAVNAGAGSLLWKYTGDSTFIYSYPAVANGAVYVESYYGTLYALNASTGALLWTYAGGGRNYCNPAVVNGVTYFAAAKTVYALNASTGVVLWSFPTPYTVWSTPAVADGTVYITTYGGAAYALNAKTGVEKWRHAGIHGSFNFMPAVANGVVYTLIGFDDQPTLYALDAKTGAELWVFVSGDIQGSPTVANGVVYIGAGSSMFALDAATGAQLWTSPYTMGSSSPAVTHGTLYFGSDGVFYAFALPSEEKEK
ncbi:MAG TPA: PQQ-binding-like beta-propeller repeat protein [Terriglobales bacterium]